MNLGKVQMSWAVVALLGVGAAASAQSLGDVARREAERRGAAPPAGKVYTNESLTPDFTKVPEPVPPAAATTAPVPGAGGGQDAGTPETAAVPDDQAGVTPRDQQEPQPSHDKGEDFWRARADRIRARLNQQNAEIADLQRRVSAFQGGAASPEREIAVRALRQAQADLVDLNDEWLRFERQARERNVPDAWIR